ncbi:MAG: hypothetical protein HZA20_10465 [Nitrospirae bacterium]|nr:hypothetical protein [Nitrospirota bacterium]
MSKRLKILMPVGPKELASTDGRMLNMVGALAKAGHSVDLLSYEDDLVGKAREKLGNTEGARVLTHKSEDRFWSMMHRDNFARTFIKLYHDIEVPGTDFKFWKQVGFDDFLWNVNVNLFPRITEKYDLVLMPVPSTEESGSSKNDVFITNVVYYAKEHKVPIAGYQLFPVYDAPIVFWRLFDYLIARDDFEREYVGRCGFSPEKVFVVDDFIDAYAMGTVEDSYKNMLFGEHKFDFAPGRLVVTVVNNPRNRPQLNEIFETIGSAKFEKELIFCFVNFAVREYHENELFEVMLRPALEKSLKKFFVVQAGGIVKALMFSDVIISTTHIVPLEFAARYGKAGVVYNPLRESPPISRGVSFVQTRQELARILEDANERRSKAVTLSGAVERIMKHASQG